MTKLLPAAALLWAVPLAASSFAASATYTFNSNSEIDYYVTHKLHHVKGVTHGLKGSATVTDDKLVTPLSLKLALITFNSGNMNRDNTAAATLDVSRYPTATLEVSSFKATTSTKDAAGLHVAGVASGRLSLHGLSHAVEVPLQALVTPTALTVDGEFTLHLTDYGIPRPALLFQPIEDDVRVTVHGVAAH